MTKTVGPLTAYSARSRVTPNHTGVRVGHWFLELFVAGRYVGICR